jgi:hypothetical protein
MLPEGSQPKAEATIIYAAVNRTPQCSQLDGYDNHRIWRNTSPMQPACGYDNFDSEVPLLNSQQRLRQYFRDRMHSAIEAKYWL